nr:hypothetical protein [Tanacetum cinerariifolium]
IRVLRFPGKQWGEICTKTLLHLISSCPLLQSFSLRIIFYNDLFDDTTTLIELFECLLSVEHLTISSGAIQWFVKDGVPQKLPTSLVNLKEFCYDYMWFIDFYDLPFLVTLMRSSPKLEKIKLHVNNKKCQQILPEEGDLAYWNSNIWKKPGDEGSVWAGKVDFDKRFVPQQELSDEQDFWLQTSHPNTDQSASSPVKIEARRELLKMKSAVQQYVVDKQCFEIEKKQFLIENDRLLDQIIDIVNIVVNSSVDMNTSVNVILLLL